jgi:hypothetical protein
MIAEQVERIIMQPNKYQLMVENCFEICDGQGAERVVNVLLAHETSRNA